LHFIELFAEIAKDQHTALQESLQRLQPHFEV